MALIDRGSSGETDLSTERATIEVEGEQRTASGYDHPYYWAPFILIGNGL
jgi:CHAT domain-containing protein